MVFNLYSKRQKRLRGEQSDVYIYTSFPQEFRTQVIYLWRKGLGEENETDNVNATYKFIASTLREEYGCFELVSGGGRRGHYSDLQAFILQEQNPERVLDAIELSFKAMNAFARDFEYRRHAKASKLIEEVISNLNIRFKEHSLGYEFTNGEIVRIDSELIHAEVVKPVLRLLDKPHLRGAEDEYLKAHEHYRHGNAKEAMNECLKAFESAMMGICKRRGWPYGEKDSAKTLLDICFKNGLVPDFWQSQMGGLRSLLEGGVPTVRNKLSGHGQGAEPTEVPSHIVGYVMHMTASALKFLAEADEALT